MPRVTGGVPDAGLSLAPSLGTLEPCRPVNPVSA